MVPMLSLLVPMFELKFLISFNCCRVGIHIRRMFLYDFSNLTDIFFYDTIPCKMPIKSKFTKKLREN
jgi:hypothetical protein